MNRLLLKKLHPISSSSGELALNELHKQALLLSNGILTRKVMKLIEQCVFDREILLSQQMVSEISMPQELTHQTYLNKILRISQRYSRLFNQGIIVTKLKLRTDTDLVDAHYCPSSYKLILVNLKSLGFENPVDLKTIYERAFELGFRLCPRYLGFYLQSIKHRFLKQGKEFIIASEYIQHHYNFGGQTVNVNCLLNYSVKDRHYNNSKWSFDDSIKYYPDKYFLFTVLDIENLN